jgi:hypothetical protein
VSRLPAALLVAWFAVLGGAMPVLACAAALPGPGHCCPDDGRSSPCPEGIAACCASSPSPTASVSSPATRAETIEPPHADTSILPGPTFALRPARAPHRLPSHFARPEIADETPVFLRTLRLRL